MPVTLAALCGTLTILVLPLLDRVERPRPGGSIPAKTIRKRRLSWGAKKGEPARALERQHLYLSELALSIKTNNERFFFFFMYLERLFPAQSLSTSRV